MAGLSTPRGRPRNPHVEQAVQKAVLELLAEGGYDAVSFQRVAARAGVGQPTVYRRWATKPELVEAAVFAVAEWTPPARQGNLAKDLTTLANVLVEGLLVPAVRAAQPGLLLAYNQNPGEHARLREWAEVPVREAFFEIVRDCVPAAGTEDDGQLSALFEVFLAGLVLPTLTRDPDGARTCVAPVVGVIAHAISATWASRPRRGRRPLGCAPPHPRTGGRHGRNQGKCLGSNRAR